MAKLHYIRVKGKTFLCSPITHLKSSLPITSTSTPNPSSLFWSYRSRSYLKILKIIESHHHILLYLCQVLFHIFNKNEPFSNRNQTCRAVHTDLSLRPKEVQTDATFARKLATFSSIDVLRARSAYANSAKASVDSESYQDSTSGSRCRIPVRRSYGLSGGPRVLFLNWKLDVHVSFLFEVFFFLSQA